MTNLECVAAIELLVAAQALDFRAPLQPGRGTAVAHRMLRELVPHLEDDRTLSPEIDAVTQLVRSGELVRTVQAMVGAL